MAIKSGKLELIDTGTDKRFVKRDKEGKVKEVVDVGRSLAADRRYDESGAQCFEQLQNVRASGPLIVPMFYLRQSKRLERTLHAVKLRGRTTPAQRSSAAHGTNTLGGRC